MNGLQWELYSTRKPLGDYNCHGKSENTNTIYGYHAIIFVIAVILGLSYSIFIFPLRISRKRNIGDFYGFLYRTEDLRHSYEKFRFAGNVNKPPFEEVYNIVKAYIYDALPKESKQ